MQLPSTKAERAGAKISSLLWPDNTRSVTYGGTAENHEVAPGIWRGALLHIKWLGEVVTNVECASSTISGQKSQFCCFGLKVAGLICGAAGRHPDTVKVLKAVDWSLFFVPILPKPDNRLKEAGKLLHMNVATRTYGSKWSREDVWRRTKISEPIIRIEQIPDYCRI